MTFHQFLVKATIAASEGEAIKFVLVNGEPFAMPNSDGRRFGYGEENALIAFCIEYWKQVIQWPTEQGCYYDASNHFQYRVLADNCPVCNFEGTCLYDPWDFDSDFRFTKD